MAEGRFPRWRRNPKGIRWWWIQLVGRWQVVVAEDAVVTIIGYRGKVYIYRIEEIKGEGTACRKPV